MEHFFVRETEDHWENNRPRCYCGCSVSLSGASSSWWIRAPLCQSCALVEQVFIFLCSLSACLSLCGPVTDEPCHGEEHPVCSHRRWLPGALARQNHVPEIWIGIFWNTKKREMLWHLIWGWVCVEKNMQSLILAEMKKWCEKCLFSGLNLTFSPLFVGMPHSNFFSWDCPLFRRSNSPKSQ